MSKKAKIFFIVLAALLAVTTFLGYHVYQLRKQYVELAAEKATLTAQLDAKKQENADLEAKIADADSETFIERMARELLGWVKPGEIKIVDKDN